MSSGMWHTAGKHWVMVQSYEQWKQAGPDNARYTILGIRLYDRALSDQHGIWR